MPDLSARQTEIVRIARVSGRVSVDGLTDRFAVTPQTIRRDLNELCEQGLLQRTHGGAILRSGVENLGYEARRLLAAEEKRRIGAAAARVIPDNASLFVNIGTTTEAVAAALTGHQGLLVITNNINVANILRTSPGIEVIIAGGLVRHQDGGIVGEATVDFIRQFRVDYAVIGASAIDADGTLLDYDYREVRVAQEILHNARKTVLVADHLKQQRSAPIRIGEIGQIDIFVTDHPPAPHLARLCQEAGVQVVVAMADAPQTNET